MMTDYNDGKWHGWNGGECPVHPKSTVEAVWHDPKLKTAGLTGPRQAKTTGTTLAWAHVVKFRVVREHKEPREFWIEPEVNQCFDYPFNGAIHVREVIDND